LLVLPSGNKYDYVCAECGTAVGGKMDNAGIRRRRRKMSAAQRKAVSVRMKKYWAARRKMQTKVK